MTRQEFINGVNSYYDLIDFCQDEYIDDALSEVYDADYLNDFIMERIGEMNDWERVRDLVNGIPTGCEYYREDGYGGFEDAMPYFEDYKREVLHIMDDSEAWDDEDEEDPDEVDADFPEEHTAREKSAYYAEPDEDIEMCSFMAVLGRAS